MKTGTHPILQTYLDSLELALQGVPVPEKLELMERVREHFESVRLENPNASDEELRAALARFGSAAALAEEMRVQFADRMVGNSPANEQVASGLSALWIPFSLALLWPAGLVGLARLGRLRTVDRLVLAALTLIGPCLTFAWLGPAAFAPNGSGPTVFIAHLLWSPLTVGGLIAGWVMLSRHVVGLSATAKSAAAVIAAAGWIALTVLTTRI